MNTIIFHIWNALKYVKYEIDVVAFLLIRPTKDAPAVTRPSTAAGSTKSFIGGNIKISAAHLKWAFYVML